MAPKPLSGAQKRKRKKIEEAFIKSQASALHKFFKPQGDAIASDDANVDANDDAKVSDVEVDLDEDYVEVNLDEDNVDVNLDEDNVEVNVDQDDVEVNVDANDVDIFDPRNWDKLSSDRHDQSFSRERSKTRSHN